MRNLQRSKQYKMMMKFASQQYKIMNIDEAASSLPIRE
jgi:hypothetical protein